ncbi:MAG: hypothetical protein IJ122_06505 [Methanobrevibacter sp.]|nr:hypothetical protein [Methanobrevibacter sp.]
MSKKDTAKSGGISTFGAGIFMSVVFFFLNVNGIIDWPWWAIMMPILVSLGMLLIAFAIALIILLIGYAAIGFSAWMKKH